MASIAIKTLLDGRAGLLRARQKSQPVDVVPDRHRRQGQGVRKGGAADRGREAKRRLDDETKNPRKPVPVVKLCGPLLDEWLAALDNRGASDDRWRGKKYLVPRFKDLPVDRLTKGEVVAWLRELKATTKLTGGTRRKIFGLLSRFCSWLSASDTISSNVCRDVGTKERATRRRAAQSPVVLRRGESARDDVRHVPPGFALMFAVGRTGGLRLCEVAGLRVADTDTLGEGVLHVRYSYDRPQLKEDKGLSADRKAKWAPIHDSTVAASLAALAKRRRDAGAKGTSVCSDPTPGQSAGYPHGGVERLAQRSREGRWCGRARLLRIHAALVFASKALANGARFEVVSKALGHSNVAITAKHYDRHVERKFATRCRPRTSARRCPRARCYSSRRGRAHDVSWRVSWFRSVSTVGFRQFRKYWESKRNKPKTEEGTYGPLPPTRGG